MKKKILLVILIILVGIQFIRPARNESAVITANDISQHYHVPVPVQDILKRACNDCHTNNTNYPWYTSIQPAGWWMQHHVDEGKRSLNLSEFGTYKPKDQDHAMEEIIEVIEKNEMPLNSYLWIHRDAKLNEADKKTLLDWAKQLKAEIAAVK
ncbi:heme-binding domain-containing protein [Pseudoflavitalea sp. X16]|uniref:heme-binding domain-containing protein n=1 Tax=Paraflavitalea devenefica TaxID=2716334 RepID=UPI00142267D4|nr:heme-binding domain-containing protein [Paraflavitalea devenefica]NII27159.1 heme-binding domain-containing protein [Paraflavitalea devenefica]